jgi:flagellar basal-body rod protein FlgF
VEFENQQKLLKTAGVMFENTEPGNLKNISNSTVVQGALEQSNVNGITELTKLINVQRSYEYVQQMIDAEHTRLSNTISAFNQMG